MNDVSISQIRVIDVIAIPKRSTVLVTVEILSGTPAYGMLFSSPTSHGVWRHLGNPHVSFNYGADPERERTFIALEPVGDAERVISGMLLIERSD